MSTHPLVELVILAVAAGSVARLVVEDTLLDAPRERLLNRVTAWRHGSILAVPLGCVRCLSFWVALIWIWAWVIWPTAALVLAVPFAAWAVASFVGEGDRA